MSDQIASLPTRSGGPVTVAELKKLIMDWPETDQCGDPTEVWVTTGAYLSSPCCEVIPLNYRRVNDENPTADLLLGPSPATFQKQHP